MRWRCETVRLHACGAGQDLTEQKIMKKEKLRQCLQTEVDAQALKSYDEFMRPDDIEGYQKGSGKAWYQVTVTVLEKTEEYVHIMVSDDDGGWRAFLPMSHSFLIYKDGRVDK